MPSTLKKEIFPRVDWGYGVVDLEKSFRNGNTLWMLWSTPRSTMQDKINEQLIGDFSWTRRAMGFLHPLNHGDPSFLSPLPNHNSLEDLRRMTWTVNPTSTEKLIDARGKRIWSQEKPFYRVSTHLYDVPHRLISGMPIVETYHWEGRMWKICKTCKTIETGNK